MGRTEWPSKPAALLHKQRLCCGKTGWYDLQVYAILSGAFYIHKYVSSFRDDNDYPFGLYFTGVMEFPVIF